MDKNLNYIVSDEHTDKNERERMVKRNDGL